MTRAEGLKLKAENAALRAENEQLRAEVAALQAQNAELGAELAAVSEQLAGLEQQGKRPPSFVKPKRSQGGGEKGPRKKRAAEHNTSRQRSEPTRIERHALERCPECQYQLSGESIDYTREVIELPPPQAVEVIEHQVIKRWCPCCEKWRSPQLDLSGQVLGQRRMGVRIAGLIAYLRTTLRMPVHRIQAYLATLHHLEISAGEIVELTHAVRQALEPQSEALRAEVQASAVVQADETGWRENGQNGYVWAFVSNSGAPLRYFVYNASRSHRVPQGILGLLFPGHLVSDFYAAYNLLRGPHQRCWVHLLRDLHALKEAYAETPEVVAWAQAVRQLYDEAQAWLAAAVDPTPTERQEEYDALLARLCALGQPYALVSEHPCQTLAKRLLRHQDELFQFVLVPGVPADNNLAERALRPLVIMRKISGGSRSAQGSKTRLALFSLLSTWEARDLNPFFHCVTLLQSPAHAPPATPLP